MAALIIQSLSIFKDHESANDIRKADVTTKRINLDDCFSLTQDRFQMSFDWFDPGFLMSDIDIAVVRAKRNRLAGMRMDAIRYSDEIETDSRFMTNMYCQVFLISRASQQQFTAVSYGMLNVLLVYIIGVVVPTTMIVVLYYFDHNIASQLAQQSESNLKKPPSYHRPVVDRLGFVVVTVVGFDNIVVDFVEDVEIVVEVVVVRIVVDSIDLVSYSTSYIRYQTGDIVRTRLSVEIKVLRDLKKVMNLGFEAYCGMLSTSVERLATNYLRSRVDVTIEIIEAKSSDEFIEEIRLVYGL
ncbi:probable boron transporter 2 isoform X1 [Tanacetum coccineum]